MKVSGDPAAVAARLNRSSLVRYAEPNLILRAQAIPNDSRFGELYGFNNTGQTGGSADADIDAPEGWDAAGLGAFPAAGGVTDRHRRHRHRPGPPRPQRPDGRLRALAGAAADPVGLDRGRHLRRRQRPRHPRGRHDRRQGQQRHRRRRRGVQRGPGDLQGARRPARQRLDRRRGQLHQLGRLAGRPGDLDEPRRRGLDDAAERGRQRLEQRQRRRDRRGRRQRGRRHAQLPGRLPAGRVGRRHRQPRRPRELLERERGRGDRRARRERAVHGARRRLRQLLGHLDGHAARGGCGRRAEAGVPRGHGRRDPQPPRRRGRRPRARGPRHELRLRPREPVQAAAALAGQLRSPEGGGPTRPAPLPRRCEPPRRGSPPPLSSPVSGLRATAWTPPKKRFCSDQRRTVQPAPLERASAASSTPGSASTSRPSTWMRGRATAASAGRPWSITPSSVCRIAERIRFEPAEPSATSGRPSRSATVGAIMLGTRAPGLVAVVAERVEVLLAEHVVEVHAGARARPRRSTTRSSR